jgi:hypothetical protein
VEHVVARGPQGDSDIYLIHVEDLAPYLSAAVRRPESIRNQADQTSGVEKLAESDHALKDTGIPEMPPRSENSGSALSPHGLPSRLVLVAGLLAPMLKS